MHTIPELNTKHTHTKSTSYCTCVHDPPVNRKDKLVKFLENMCFSNHYIEEDAIKEIDLRFIHSSWVR